MQTKKNVSGEVEVLSDGSNRMTLVFPEGARVEAREGLRLSVDKLVELFREARDTSDVVGQCASCKTWDENVCNIPVS